MSSKRRHPYYFVAALVGGIVVYLTTDNAIAGAILPSIHAGWRSLRTGVWIIHVDQQRPRAQICSAFCIATALWQAAAAALLAVVGFVVVASFTGRQPNIEHFAATMITLTTGVILSSLLGLLASIAAAVHKVRVWIHPKLREFVHDELLGAAHLHPQVGFNYAICVLATSLALPLLALCCYLLVDVRPTSFTIALLLGGPFLSLGTYIWLSSRIIAFHPAECWAPEILTRGSIVDS